MKKTLLTTLLLSVGLMATTPLPTALTQKHISIDLLGKPELVLPKEGFTIHYSCKNKTPHYSYYKVTPQQARIKGGDRRHISFRPDYQLPIKCRSYSRDYSRTGYDRGHLAPNAILDYNPRTQKQTFLMSNIAPQAPVFNRKVWSKVERFVRLKALKQPVEVITGVCGTKGHIKRDVNIPKYFYKIVNLLGENKVVYFIGENNNKKRRVKELLTTKEDIEQKCDIKIKEQ